ncbi:enoyl-CoA hydratase/isomerase family protein [Pseudonocardia sp.]|uniref:enoyl-CoA hydratase/isomerase family protein n=1 Tax=Pseudonocardia sp. TaxID=60912 RepID=UPI003D0A9077
MTATVLARVQGAAGRLTLNRPAALNALDLPMIRALTAALAEWERDDAVAVVVLDGAGPKGLCAGGDVRFMYDDVRSGGHEFATLLAEEYALDAGIARYPKPYVALMDGVVMGGGVGLSAHGGVRVVTERTVLAMPECSIGYVPDVGGTWLLARAPGELGTHAALTGARLRAADAIACGLADVHVPSGRLPELVAALTAVTGGPGCVEETVRGFATDPGPSALVADRPWIDGCYAGDTVTEIVDLLRGAGHAPTAEQVLTGAPLALVMTLRAVRSARTLSLPEALRQEYRLTRSCTRWPDFAEGVRARLIDRDTPRWEPATLRGVTVDVVCEFLRGGTDPADPEIAFPPQ